MKYDGIDIGMGQSYYGRVWLWYLQAREIS